MGIEKDAIYNKAQWKEMYFKLKQMDDRILASFDTDPLTTLDPDRHWLSFFGIMMAQLAEQPTQALFQHCYRFAHHIDKATEVVQRSDVQQFLDRLVRLANIHNNHKALVAILQVCCLVATKEQRTLTPFHQVFFKYCLLTKTHFAAEPVLERGIEDVDAKIFHLTVQDFMLYHYYGAIILLGLKQVQKARLFLQTCLSTPANDTSLIQIKAYKKWILVDLIVFGKLHAPIPKYVPLNVSRALREQAKAYLDLGRAFEARSLSKMEERLSVDQPLFVADGNLGLVKQCFTALLNRKIHTLTESYLTLSLKDIAKLVEESVEAGSIEAALLKMIQEGDIHATISHRDNGMVSFEDDPEDFENMDTAKALQEKIEKLQATKSNMSLLTQELSLSKEYIQRTAGAQMAAMQQGLEDEIP
ncbi:hypothetical protein EDD86DRAFT_189094 [Gorgonomyces haynaldii]|nr:hypothetical protein EDD86DRAFT_189094 [Gorgonomyces haynaldii]